VLAARVCFTAPDMPTANTYGLRLRCRSKGSVASRNKHIDDKHAFNGLSEVL